MSKLIFADVDGTILKHGREEASPAVVEVVEEMLSRGDILVPVTSRTSQMMGGLALQLGLRHLGVLDGGATMFDFGRNVPDEERTHWLMPQTTQQTVEVVAPYCDEIYYGADSQLYSGNESTWRASPSVFAVHPNAMQDNVRGALSQVVGGVDIHFNAYEDKGTHSCVQVVRPGVSKRSGVEAILADPLYNHFAPEDIVAIGDGYPDVDLLLAMPKGATLLNVGDNEKLRAVTGAITVPPAAAEGFAIAMKEWVLR